MSAVLKLEMQCYRDGVPAVFCREESALILVSRDEKEEVVCQAEHIRVMLDEMFPELEVELYGGDAHKGFRGIGKSYREGRERQRMMQGWITYYYPLELEMEMINYMKLGNFTDAGVILDEIRTENGKRDLLPREQSRVIGLIFEVFYHFTETMRLELPDLRYDFLREADPETYEKQWDLLREILRRIEEKYAMSSDASSLGKELVNYVDTHYADSELSQQSMANIFRISRPTVSKLFKETAKMNFIDYLHKKRVEHTKIRFDEGEADVINVGREVGYENEVTFKRAFVKHEGVTPREYLRLLKMKGSSEK